MAKKDKLFEYIRLYYC